MGFENMTFWLFLAATVVASLAFVSIVVWAANRLKERQEYYRFEFRKRLVEEGKMDARAFASLMRYEHELKQQQAREKLKVSAFVMIGVGVGLCFGLQFIGHSIWMVGLIPMSIGLFMMIYGVFFAANPTLGSPPAGWLPESTDGDESGV